MATDFLSEMEWRGQLHQVSNAPGLRAHIGAADGAGAGQPRKAYIGFDPTSSSFTVGNLVQMVTLARWQRAGHVPVVLAGGGTGMIGDPSGKSAERQLMTRETVAANVASQMKIFERVIDFSPSSRLRATLLNNADWLEKLSYIDALRDIGKHFSVNVMMQKDSVRDRLNNREHGISYTEFSYMLLQAYDFYYLYKAHGVTVQMGGSDQWGNMTAGTDLIRKIYAAEDLAAGRAEAAERETFVVTTPLFTKSDGTKFGKTESGAVWLSADRTSPFAFYQFWLNSADSDVPKLLKTFTFFDRARTEELIAGHEKDAAARTAHRALAQHMTELMHGKTEADHAEAASKALFAGEVAALPEKLFVEVMATVPGSKRSKSELGGEGLALADLLVATELAKSKRESREFLTAGSVTVNGQQPAGGADATLTSADLLHGKYITLRRGKKQWHLIEFA